MPLVDTYLTSSQLPVDFPMRTTNINKQLSVTVGDCNMQPVLLFLKFEVTKPNQGPNRYRPRGYYISLFTERAVIC